MADTNVHVIPRPCFFLCPSSSPLSSRHFLARIPLDTVKPSFQNLSIEFIYAFMVTRVTHSNTCLCLRKCLSFVSNEFFFLHFAQGGSNPIIKFSPLYREFCVESCFITHIREYYFFLLEKRIRLEQFITHETTRGKSKTDE